MEERKKESVARVTCKDKEFEFYSDYDYRMYEAAIEKIQEKAADVEESKRQEWIKEKTYEYLLEQLVSNRR